MKQRACMTSGIRSPLVALAALIVTLGLVILPNQARAQVTCPTTSTADSDGDGFTDAQECTGITLADGSLFPSCVASTLISRANCLDPNTKDIFVVVVPATPTSLLPSGFNPFGKVTFFGINFSGFSALGVTAHQITAAQAAVDRTVTTVTGQKAARVAESLDTSSTLLGLCNWGTPDALDGCVVYTQRIINLINSACNSAGDTTTDRTAVFNAYTTHTFLHEVGHSLGGLSTTYNSRYGGYHYASGSGLIMEQSETYSTKGGKCTWNISSGWNTTLDPPGVILK